MTDDALPLVEPDPTPPLGTPSVGARTAPRSWSGLVTLSVVLAVSLAALIAVAASVT